MGRPMEVDPEGALGKAMQVFWSQGYEATSTADLLAAMGLSKSSLYQTFGSKRQLFLRCLDHYCQQGTNVQRAKLAGAKPGKQFLINRFREMTKPGEAGKPKGCLLVNTACEFGEGGEEREFGSFVESALEKSKRVFQGAIEQAQSDGEIPKDKDPRQLAEFLRMSACGLMVMRKMNTDQSTLNRVVDEILSHLD